MLLAGGGRATDCRQLNGRVRLEAVISPPHHDDRLNC